MNPSNFRTLDPPRCCLNCKYFNWNHEMCGKHTIFFDGKIQASVSICDDWEDEE